MKKLLLLFPVFIFALEPVLVSKQPYQSDPFKCYSPNRQYCGILELGTGTPEFIPIETFTLTDTHGNIIYTKRQFNHTVVDIANNGYVVAGDFYGPINGRTSLHL